MEREDLEFSVQLVAKRSTNKSIETEPEVITRLISREWPLSCHKTATLVAKSAQGVPEALLHRTAALTLGIWRTSHSHKLQDQL